MVVWGCWHGYCYINYMKTYSYEGEVYVMEKLTTIENVLRRIEDGAVIMIGGFLDGGAPKNLIEGLVKKGVKELIVIANDTAFVDKGIGKLVVNKQVKKFIVSHIGTNPETGRQMNAGEIEMELVPQGTLAERIRAGGAGLGGILTPTGIGTIVEEGKKKIEVAGKEYLLELPIRADIALIKAYRADAKGNLIFRYASRNFNPIMATAADYVVAEIEHFVQTGEIEPNDVMLPGIFVDALVLAQTGNNAKKGGA